MIDRTPVSFNIYIYIYIYIPHPALRCSYEPRSDLQVETNMPYFPNQTLSVVEEESNRDFCVVCHLRFLDDYICYPTFPILRKS
jgi:hypothetical protein